jgi:5-formyltetrahydrofolate cyclo-ligase
MDKQSLRASLALSRDKLSPQFRTEASAKITENMLWLAEDAKRIGTYLSFESEVDTIDAIISWLYTGKEVYVPRMQGADFIWMRLKDFKNLENNAFGIPEPIDGESVDVDTLDVVFVPMFGFDDALHRIGHGKGCFDRALNSYTGKKIGLCYAMGHVDTIYPSVSDIPMDIVITENEIFSQRR